MPKDKFIQQKTVEELRKSFENCNTGYDSGNILIKADKERSNNEIKEYGSNTAYYKALSLFEFEKGVLLLNSLPELHIVFALDFNKNLQKEFDCKTASEKSLAEVVTLNFIRILETQRKIKDNQTSVKTRYDIQYIAILSKELDRAERHYLTSLEALRMVHSPILNMNIKANSAVIGQNQVVQVKNA